MAETYLEEIFQVVSSFRCEHTGSEKIKAKLSGLRRKIQPLANRNSGDQIANDITGTKSKEVLSYLFYNLDNAANFAREVVKIDDVNKTSIGRIDKENPESIPFTSSQRDYLVKMGFSKVSRKELYTLL